MFKVGGYRPSAGTVKCPVFSSLSDKFVKLAANVSDIYIIPEYTPISTQGSIGSCVGNATGDCLEILKGLEDPSKVEQVSRLFIYWDARNTIHETNKDDGCLIHDAMNSLKTLGVCRESVWPYIEDNVLVHPPLEAYREGSDNTITEFYQITSTGAQRLRDIETAIRARHPVIFGTLVGQEFKNYIGGEKVFDPPSHSVGGHSMIITGIKLNTDGTRAFYARNSWGQWGINGHAWLSEKYMTWSETSDLFVPTRMKDFTI